MIRPVRISGVLAPKIGRNGGDLRTLLFPSTTTYGLIAQPVYQATYYKNLTQNLINGVTDVTFDLTGSWNITGGYITHTNGSKDFTVVRTGLYHLEFNCSVIANSATWNQGTNKAIFIDITRPPIAEQAIIGQTALTASVTNYAQSLSTTFYLMAGDVINLRVQCNFATATPYIQSVQNTFDLNTFFTWKFIS